MKDNYTRFFWCSGLRVFGLTSFWVSVLAFSLTDFFPTVNGYLKYLKLLHYQCSALIVEQLDFNIMVVGAVCPPKPTISTVASPGWGKEAR